MCPQPPSRRVTGGITPPAVLPLLASGATAPLKRPRPLLGRAPSVDDSKVSIEKQPAIAADSAEALLNTELSWLAFASRVIAQVEDDQVPLFERVKFAGISGMLHDEFFMKRMSGLKRQIEKGSSKLSIDGRRAGQQLKDCRHQILGHEARLARTIRDEIRPSLENEGIPILDHDKLDKQQKKALRNYFRSSVLPILTPLAVDSEHPFPFISNLGLNLAVVGQDSKADIQRFVRIKVPDNRPRWVPLPDNAGFVPLEQIIAANLDLLYPGSEPQGVYLFRITRGAEGDTDRANEFGDGEPLEPGSIVRQVTHELKARRFAGVVRLQIDPSMPKRFRKWLASQAGVNARDIYTSDCFLGLNDLLGLKVDGREDLRFPAHTPATHPRLSQLSPLDSGAIFDEISRGDILLHHPYHSFESSVLRFIEAASTDAAVLAIKLTIYRTSRDSPIIRALAEASRRGKQVAVLVEITARFDEAPNIAWGRYLENEGVHVAYGVERLKTHVKLALVVREEADCARRYAHVGTGNYHSGTARIYEDIGVLTCDPAICEDVASVFNTLTGTTSYDVHSTMLVAPISMRRRFTEMIRREAEHASQGRPSGIDAKMNQLQDPDIIRELYEASRAGVPIKLNIRGLCCLRPGVAGLSDNIRVFGVVGRFLEHSRVYRFTNAGQPEYYVGSADWMRRNLKNRVETVVQVVDPILQRQLDSILSVYDEDNCSAWDCGSQGDYVRRRPAQTEDRRAAQEVFIQMAAREAQGHDSPGKIASDVEAVS